MHFGIIIPGVVALGFAFVMLFAAPMLASFIKGE